MTVSHVRILRVVLLRVDRHVLQQILSLPLGCEEESEDTRGHAEDGCRGQKALEELDLLWSDAETHFEGADVHAVEKFSQILEDVFSKNQEHDKYLVLLEKNNSAFCTKM